MLRFSAAFNCPNRVDREKDKYITSFPKIVKIMEK